MKPHKILVVDDVSSIRLYLKAILQKLDVSISEAKDGIEAFQLIKDNEFDLILMDIEMPGESGLEVTRRVRQELGYKYTPIIIMTALQKPELIEHAFALGATDYISKPLSEFEVLSRLQFRIESHQMARELSEAKKLAETASHAKSEFISHLAHELKTPLNAIYGFTQLIELDAEDPEIIESCTFILNAVKHQEGLINEVTNLAKIEAGIIDINLSEVELSSVIKESLTLILPMAEKNNITLNFPRRTDVMYTLNTDKKRLKQILLNLLSNAIKYNRPNGEINILVKPVSDDCIKIGVADTGLGIASDDIPKLFEAFNRLGAEDSDIEGSGIGLPITKQIIELMGGVLEVESTVGKGTTFWVELAGVSKASKTD